MNRHAVCVRVCVCMRALVRKCVSVCVISTLKAIACVHRGKETAFDQDIFISSRRLEFFFPLLKKARPEVTIFLFHIKDDAYVLDIRLFPWERGKMANCGEIDGLWFEKNGQLRRIAKWGEWHNMENGGSWGMAYWLLKELLEGDDIVAKYDRGYWLVV